jgi:hypothetical protein
VELATNQYILAAGVLIEALGFFVTDILCSNIAAICAYYLVWAFIEDHIKPCGYSHLAADARCH